MVMISFYVLSKRLFLKRKGLSDIRVVSVTKKEYGFAVHFSFFNIIFIVTFWWIINWDFWSSRLFGIFIKIYVHTLLWYFLVLRNKIAWKKTVEIFILFHLINISVTIWLSFLLLIITAIISRNTLNTLRFLYKLYLSIFYIALCIIWIWIISVWVFQSSKIAAFMSI